ncbi:MAG: adenosylcobinamide-GDP ribazoletransferase [Ardenticatenaceae bacterium]|nr:adenosylcobinamide-GDP ribazoletransferase [Ardenticatenaceae bacterium]
MKLLWLSISFLTTLPAPAIEFIPGGLSRASRFFPTVGLILAALLGGAGLISMQLFPPILSAALLIALWVILTGGLHLDGLADCCDGLFVPVARERRLEIMKDPHTGSFAVVGLVIVLLLKTAALTALFETGRWWFALLSAGTISRWLILAAARQPQARTNGMGADFAAGITPHDLIVALILPLFVSVWAGWPGVFSWLPAAAVLWGWSRLAGRRIGGVTGDVYGAVVETAEVAILLTFVAWSRFG